MGFAEDSLHMLALGAKVTACEIHTVIHFLVERDLEECPEIQDRFHLLLGDSLDHLAEMAQGVDVFYFDPMFEEVTKKSLPKKNILFLRNLPAPASPPSHWVEKALKVGAKKVVVKRPPNGEHLYGRPTSILSGKLVRYDVYINKD